MDRYPEPSLFEAEPALTYDDRLFAAEEILRSEDYRSSLIEAWQQGDTGRVIDIGREVWENHEHLISLGSRVVEQLAEHIAEDLWTDEPVDGGRCYRCLRWTTRVADDGTEACEYHGGRL